MKSRKNNNLNFLNSVDKNELTIEKLRTYSGFEDVSEDEAKEHIKLIKTFARVLFDVYKNDQIKESVKT